MTKAKPHIIGDMLLETSLKHINNNQFFSAAKVMVVLITEFGYQFALLKSLETILLEKDFQTTSRIIRYLVREIESTKEIGLNRAQLSYLNDFSISFASLLEKIADLVRANKDTGKALQLYQASIYFNPGNSNTRNKFYGLWEEAQDVNTYFKKAAFLDDIYKITDSKDDSDND